MHGFIPIAGQDDPWIADEAFEQSDTPLEIGDCREKMGRIPSADIDLIVTDPPYFLDGLDSQWKKGKADAPKATGSVGGLPVGMKFDTAQGKALQAFMRPVADQMLRVLKPGGFALVFSQPRLSHRMAIALEDAGFEIRDLCVWHYRSKAQFKAFKQDHFVRRMDITEQKKSEIIKSMGGRKTPQLRGQHETIVLAQKPREGTFIENWMRWKVGLMDASATLDGTCPSNVMAVEKADRSELGAAAAHLTPKPQKLLRHLIDLFSTPGQIVLDPFMGSGSTAVAALGTGRRWRGIEINPDYAHMALRRIGEVGDDTAKAQHHQRAGDRTAQGCLY